MRHATRMYESRHIYMCEWWYTYKKVVSHTFMSHVTHIQKLCHAHVQVPSRICASYDTRTKESCCKHIRMCSTHSHAWHDAFVCVPCLMHMCAMTHACVRHDSWMCVTWLMNVCDMTHECVTWLTDLYDMTGACVWHDSFMCVTWPMHICAMPYWYVCHDSCMCVHVRDVTHGSHVNDKSWLTHKWHLCVSHDKKGLTHKWRGLLHHSSQINVTHRLCVQTRHLWVIIMKKCVYVCLHSSLMCNNNLSFMSSNNK